MHHGKYLEQFVFDPQENSTKSKYKFPKDEPTKTDWTQWTKFWLTTRQQEKGYRWIWANGYIQPTEHGGGITTKKQMTYKGSKRSPCITTIRQEKSEQEV